MRMQTKRNILNMPPTTPTDPWPLPELTRARRAIVVVDVVESVRLMQEDEAGFIDRWRRFVHQVRTEVLPKHGGRLVKSLGDGLLLEFDGVRVAAAAALAIQALLDTREDRSVTLRIGLHEADVVVDDLDIYGQGVNLAARLATLGRPGDIVLSDQARDRLVDGWDARIEDLGSCYVKHVETPLRVFRISPAIDLSHPPPAAAPALMPTIAVLPLAVSPVVMESKALARVLVDDIVASLARCQGWRVISALTTGVAEEHALEPAAIVQRLSADYTLNGSLVHGRGSVRVALHLDSHDGEVVWSCTREVPVDSLLLSQERLASWIAHEATSAALALEWRSARHAALPTLRGYTLLLQAISLMHRFAAGDNRQSLQTLEHLLDRYPRAPDVRAWTAKWHFMQLPQKVSRDRRADIARARAEIARALDIAPDHTLSAALEAYLLVYAERDPGRGLSALDLVLAKGPNEPLAWLFKANALALLGHGAQAVEAVDQACTLSPLDPLGYFFDTFAAQAYRIAGQHSVALARAERSVRSNATHLPGWVQLMLAQAACGRIDAARVSAGRYMALQPSASVQRFVDYHAATSRSQIEREAQALREAGIPL